MQRGNTGIDATFRSYVNVQLPNGVTPNSEQGLQLIEDQIMRDAQSYLDERQYSVDMTPADVVVEIGGTEVAIDDLDELRSGGRLQRLAMYGIDTPIKHWNDVSVPGDRMCVIDALWYYIYKLHNSKSNIALRGVRSRQQIVDEMTKILSPVDQKGNQWTTDMGVSVQQLVKYIRTKDLPFNIYMVDPFEFVFFSDTNTNGRIQNDRSIVLKMNGGDHATLIHDTHLIKDVAQSVGTYSSYVSKGFNNAAASKWPKFNYKKEFDKWWEINSHLGAETGDPFGEEFDQEFIQQHFLNRMYDIAGGSTGIIVHNLPTPNIPADHILPLIIQEFERHVEHVLFDSRGNVISLIVPGIPVIQLNFAYNYEEVQELAERMNELSLMKLSQRTNLSATSLSKMSKDFYLSHVGYWPKSQLGGHVWKTLTAHKVGGLQQTYEDCDGDIAIDIRKCYASCMIDNEQPYPVFDVLSDWKPFLPGVDIDERGKFKIGLFHITEPLVFPWLQDPGKIAYAHRAVFPYQILSTNFVEWCVQKGVLDPKNIDAWLPARGTIPADLFRVPTETLLELGGAKHMINRFVGMCGVTQTSYSKGAMVYDKDVAATLHGTYLFKEQVNACIVNPIFKKGEDEPIMYNVQYNEHIPLLEDSNIGVYWTVICAGFMKLMQLAERVFTEFGYTIKAVNTDCVVVDITQHPGLFFERMRDKLEEEDPSVPGHYRICYINDDGDRLDLDNLKRFNLRKSYVDGFEQYKRAAERIGALIPEWNRLDAVCDDASFLVDGMPGSGKSWTLANNVYTPGNTLVMTYTATSMENLNTAFGIKENVCTFEKIETICAYRGGGGSYGNASHRVVVDYMSQYDKVVADEYSNMSPKWLLRMSLLKLRYPHVQIALFGDKHQTRPVCKLAGFAERYKCFQTKQAPEMTYDALQSSACKFLCDYNLVRLEYRADCGRFDRPLQRVVRHLVEADWFDTSNFATKTSPCNCRHRCTCSIDRITKLPEDHDYDAGYHIVKTNKLKAVIDKLSMEKHNESRQDIMHVPYNPRISRRDGYSPFDMYLSEGMRMICSKGGETTAVDKKDAEEDDDEDLDNPERELTRFYNGQRWTVYAIDLPSSTICLKKVGGTGGVLKALSHKEINTSFELDYAVTAYRSQSQTIYNNVYVHQCWSMPRSELLVAISRATTINKVFLCGVYSDAVHTYNEDPYQTARLVGLPFVLNIKTYTVWEVSGYDSNTKSNKYYYGYTPSTDMKVVEEDVFKKTQSANDKPLYFIKRQGNELSWKILTVSKYSSDNAVKRDIEYIWPLRGLDSIVCDNEEDRRKLAKHFTTRAKRLYAQALVPIVNELPAVKRGRPPKRKRDEDEKEREEKKQPEKKPQRKFGHIRLETKGNGKKGTQIRVNLGSNDRRQALGSWNRASEKMASKIANKYRVFIAQNFPNGTVDFKDYHYGGRDSNEYNLRHFFENTLGYFGMYENKMTDREYNLEFQATTEEPDHANVSQYMPAPLPNVSMRIRSDETESRAKTLANEVRAGYDSLAAEYLDTLETRALPSNV